MGIDMTFYPKKATKNQLVTLAKSLGFVCQSDYFHTNPKGSTQLFWFENKDFLSEDGNILTIYPVSDDESISNVSKWAVHLRARIWASIYDVKHMNLTLRTFRKQFGGTFTGDYGTNKYIPLWEDSSTPISRGIEGVWGRIDGELSSLKFAIKNAVKPLIQQTNDKANKFAAFTEQLDPTRTLYNALIPFIISAFESFFSRVFQILIKYDNKAIEKMESYKQSVSLQEVIRIEREECTVEEIISNNYSFQNIEQINKAYREWLDIDIKKLLSEKKRIRGRVQYLLVGIEEIINLRHSVVHHFMVDRSLTEKQLLSIISAIESIFNLLINEIECKYSIKIEKISIIG